MTGDELDRAIEFLLQQQASFQASMTRFEMQAEADRKEMRASNEELRYAVNALAEQAEADRAEIRDAIGKLVDVVENTRDFTMEIAQLAKNTSYRVADIESRVEKLENP